jgi:hypothetical protein
VVFFSVNISKISCCKNFITTHGEAWKIPLVCAAHTIDGGKFQIQKVRKNIFLLRFDDFFYLQFLEEQLSKTFSGETPKEVNALG